LAGLSTKIASIVEATTAVVANTNSAAVVDGIKNLHLGEHFVRIPSLAAAHIASSFRIHLSLPSVHLLLHEDLFIQAIQTTLVDELRPLLAIPYP